MLRHVAGSFQSSGEARDKALQSVAVATTEGERLQAKVLAARAEQDVAQAIEDKIRIERILPIPGQPLPDVAQLLAWREQLYQREDPAWRRAVHIERLLWIDRYIDQAPRREVTPSEISALEVASAARAAFVRATDSYLTYSERQSAAAAAAQADLETVWQTARRADEREIWGGRVVRSPAGILAVRGDVDSQGWGTTLGSAFWREEIGQRRPHGVGPLRAFVLADIDTRLAIRPRQQGGGHGLVWLGNRARLFEYASVTQVPEAAGLRWLQRLGWGLEVGSDLGPGLSNSRIRLDGYALLLDGLSSPWLLGGRAGIMPTVRMRGDRGVQLSAIVEAFAQRRLRATGRLRLAVSAAQTWQHLDRGEAALHAALTLSLPLGDRESWSMQWQAGADCNLVSQCSAVGSAGVAF